MPINNIVISNYDTEKEFVSKFVKSVMNETIFTSNHTLACKIGANATTGTVVSTAEEVDTQLDTVYGNSSNTPTLWFTIDANFTIKMQKYTNLTASDNKPYFRAEVFFGDTSLKDNLTLDFNTNSVLLPSRTDTRALKYQIVSNANVLYIVFGKVSDNFPLAQSSSISYPSLFIYKKNSEIVGGTTVGSTLATPDGENVSAVNRLPYVNNAVDPTSIETIQNKVVINSAGQNKVITMDNVWDSTYNSAVMFPVNIGSSQYVYLDNYTLMPI